MVFLFFKIGQFLREISPVFTVDLNIAKIVLTSLFLFVPDHSAPLSPSSNVSFHPKFRYDLTSTPHTPKTRAFLRHRASVVECDTDLLPPTKQKAPRTVEAKAALLAATREGAGVGPAGKAGVIYSDSKTVAAWKKDPLVPPALRGLTKVDSKGFR